MAKRVAIVGAGASGLTVGVSLREKHATKDLDVTIFAENFPSNGMNGIASGLNGIASGAAGGIIKPAIEEPADDAGKTYDRRWTKVTYDRLRQMREDGVGAESGLNEFPFITAHKNMRSDLPWYTSLLHPEIETLSDAEREEYGVSPAYPTVWKYDTFRIEPSKYLKYLADRFVDQGGHTVQRKISNFNELAQDYDVVVNCAGLGARKLTGDLSLYCVRGQMLEAEGPDLNAMYFSFRGDDPDQTYIVPSHGKILLGSTDNKDDWSTALNPEHTADIYKRCVTMCPKLKSAKIVGGWVGLRPWRETVRLEADEEFAGESLLIHNYGHSCNGFIFSWGCAEDIVELVMSREDIESRE